MKDVFKKVPDEIIQSMQAALAKADAAPLPPEFVNRFKAPMHRVKLTEDGTGLEMAGTVENTNILLDFGQPVQVLGFTPKECFAFLQMVQEMMKTAMVREIVNEATEVKAQ